MKKSAFAVRSHIRNVVLCSLVTFGLAACGADGSSSSGTTSVAADPTPSLVSPSAGVIDRTSATAAPSAVVTANLAANTTPVAAPVSATTPTSSSTKVVSTTTPATSTTPSSSTTTVASTNKTSTNSTAPAPMPTPTKSNNPTTGSATLDWMPPTENTDGSVLSDLAGYTVYYGTAPGNLTQSVKITNPGLTAYTLSNLPSGTWYFAVSSYSSAGIESTPSGVVNTTI